MILTKYNHMTDNELLRHAFMEAKTDLERELMKRLALSIDEVAEHEEMMEQLDLEFEEATVQ